MPGFSVLAYQAQQLDGFAEALGPISSAGEYKVKMNSVDEAVYATVNAGPWRKIIDSGGLVVVVSLQAAYNGGNTITTAGGLPVAITGSGTTVALRLAGAVATAGGLEMASTATLAVSVANEGRLRYNSGTQSFQVSMNGAAFVDLSVGAATLQSAYNAGASITVTVANPVLIQNAAGVNSDLISLLEKSTSTNSNRGLSWNRTVTPVLNANFTGDGVSVVNVPATANNCTENARLVLVSHQPTGGAGVVTDTTTGVWVSMSPTAALSAVTGVAVIMASTVAGPGISVTHNGSTATSLSVAIRLAGAQQSAGLEMSNGQNLAVSNATEGRIRYNNATSAFEVSISGAAYVPIGTGTSSTLQAAYTAGATITLTAAKPIALTENNTATNADFGVTWSRAIAPDAASVFTGAAITISNTPTGTNSSTEGTAGAGGLLRVTHAPVAGAGTITDNMVGINVAITPVATNTSVRGIVVTMGANASGALAALFSGATISCPGAGSTSERFGAGATAAGTGAVALGNGAVAGRNNAVIIGIGTSTAGSAGAAMIGIGQNVTATGDQSIAIGVLSTASSDTSTAIGGFSTCSATNCVAVGHQANCITSGQSVAIGQQAQCGAGVGVSVGALSQSLVAGGIAIGYNCTVLNSGGAGDIAIGANATATNTLSIAIGQNVTCNVANAVAIGRTLTDMYVGSGITKSVPVNFTINATGGLGGGVAGASLSLAGGKSGDAATAGGAVNLRTTVAGAGQTLVTVLSVTNAASVTVTTGTATAGLRIIASSGTASGGLEMTDASTLGVSAAAEGRIRYNNAGSGTFQISTQGGAYVNIATGAGGGATLQTAYTAGASIAVTAANPVVITNTTGVAGDNLKLDYRNTAGTTSGVFSIVVGASTTPAAAIVGSLIDLSTNVVAAAQQITGQKIIVAANTAAAASLVGALVIDSGATLANVIDCSVNNTGGPLWQLRYKSAQTLAATLTGLTVDLTTNVTPGAVSVVGSSILIPATTSTSAIGLQVQSAQKAGSLIAIAPSATATNAVNGFFYQRTLSPSSGSSFTGVGLSLLNTPIPISGTFTESWLGISIVHQPTRIGGTTTDTSTGISVQLTPAQASTNTGCVVTLGANVTAGFCYDAVVSAANRGTTATLRQNGQQIFVNSGAPNNANGNNGDLYFRTDGTPGTLGVALGTCVYFKAAGAWSNIA